LTHTLVAAGLSDRGQRREKNEDSYLLESEEGILIVADGLGGRPAGEVASRLACETAHGFLSGEGSSFELGPRMARAVTLANEKVWGRGQEDPDFAGMGTTLTLLVFDLEGMRVGIGHVGDSRAYRWRNERLERVTTDHTLVQELVDAGAIAPEEADGHPLGYLLNRAIGTESHVEAQVLIEAVEAGDLFLLCTDGLLAALAEADIAEVLVSHLGPTSGSVASELRSEGLAAAAAEFVRLANERGAPDNVTVGLIEARPQA
jgi:protein phosphatase